MNFEMPIRLVSVANLREHWAVKAKRAKAHRREAFIEARRHGLLPMNIPLTITIERVGKKYLDLDNLANALEMDDGHANLHWKYTQSIGKTYKVKVFIEQSTGA